MPPEPHEGLGIRGNDPKPPVKMTIRGVPAKPTTSKKVVFDEKTGISARAAVEGWLAQVQRPRDR
jgi:hypothetical protein